MTLPRTDHPSLERHERRLARVAALGYRNTGRGAVVIFSDVQGICRSRDWRGTEHPYFLEDCLLRRLVHDIWLRNSPDRRETLSKLVHQMSTYDPSEGMVVVVLSPDGGVWIHDIRFDSIYCPPSAAA